MKTSPSPAQRVRIDDSVLAVTGFAYVQSDVPSGMRLDQWHFARNRARRATQTRVGRERRKALIAELRHRTGRS